MQVIHPSFKENEITFQYTDVEGELLLFKGIVDSSGVTGIFHLPDAGALEIIRLERKQSCWNQR